MTSASLSNILIFATILSVKSVYLPFPVEPVSQHQTDYISTLCYIRQIMKRIINYFNCFRKQNKQ